ncbi:galactose-1-phosphate uridylyltransferase [Phaffia rhodozyma]|uniref:Galactose-1-phosphate uridylyltransferase n=1 Tax=Phaffia rhodozyma TaxID=264483 RepID=A0A0F7SEJ8_PHARH|nr:galactose-1-phosphate uridylyltransferase [Phaffia rhodozyma]
MEFDPSDHPHRRYNPLTKTHVLVSPHRTKRPWLGQVDPPAVDKLPEYDAKCYLCPGNERMGGGINEQYPGVYRFTNDFQALLPPPIPTISPDSALSVSGTNFFEMKPVGGNCDVICFSPRHDLTLAKMSEKEIESVVRGWTEIWESKAKEEDKVEYVQIFENRGSMMGASNPHPHGQVWSLSYIPTEPALVLESLKEYSEAEITKGKCLLLDYAMLEAEKKERVIAQNKDWVVVVPFWAVWPYETMVLPLKRRIRSLAELTQTEVESLAEITKALLVKYDNLFSCPFSYSMGIHQSPSPRYAARLKAENKDDVSQLHFLYYPPLLRSASVRKFAVGFELLSESQRDLTPEQAAAKLQACEDVHYLERIKDSL